MGLLAKQCSSSCEHVSTAEVTSRRVERSCAWSAALQPGPDQALSTWQVMFGPSLAADGSTSLSLVGAGTFKVFKVADPAGLKPVTAALGRHSSQNFTCHLWLVDGAARSLGMGWDELRKHGRTRAAEHNAPASPAGYCSPAGLY